MSYTRLNIIAFFSKNTNVWLIALGSYWPPLSGQILDFEMASLTLDTMAEISHIVAHLNLRWAPHSYALTKIVRQC